MKVLLLVPHLSDGGGERIVSDLSLSLRSAEIVLAVFEKKSGYPFGGRLVSLELPVDRRSVARRLWGFIRRVLRFRRLLRSERPEAVLSFMGEANLINALVSKRPVVTVHNHLSSLADASAAAASSARGKVRAAFEARVHRFLVGLLYRRATVVAVAGAVQSELIEHFHVPRTRITVIPNAVDAAGIAERAEAPVDCPWPKDRPVVITAGRLTAAKGQWHLLRSFARLRGGMPCSLAILGAGELEGYLHDLARDAGVASDVHFLGWQENPFRFLSRASLFVLPSVTEAFGLVLLEAMACGLPVVCADCPGGPREIVAPSERGPSVDKPLYGDYGVLVPPFDGRMRSAEDPCTEPEAQLAEVLRKMLSEPPLRERYRQAGRRRLKDFDHDRFVGEYERLLDRVAGR